MLTIADEGEGGVSLKLKRGLSGVCTVAYTGPKYTLALASSALRPNRPKGPTRRKGPAGPPDPRGISDQRGQRSYQGHRGHQGHECHQGHGGHQGHECHLGHRGHKGYEAPPQTYISHIYTAQSYTLNLTRPKFTRSQIYTTPKFTRLIFTRSNLHNPKFTQNLHDPSFT